MRFLAALSFLTIIPLPLRREISPEEVGRSLVYFPVVGLIIGLMLAVLNLLFSFLFPPPVTNGLLIVSLVIISGALHLDGLADTCDGLAGYKTTEARWQVMRDGRVGAFGVIGVFLLLLLQYVSLSNVPENWLVITLVLMPVVSRWAMVYAVFAYPYARPAGMGRAFKQGASWQRFSIASVITLAVATGLARWAGVTYFFLAGLAVMFIIWVMVVVVAAYLKRKFSGLTGDNYGAINEIAEVSVLLLIILLAHNHWLI